MLFLERNIGSLVLCVNNKWPPDHHQGIICGVAFARSSLRRIDPYASVVAPRRLASDALLLISNCSKPTSDEDSGNLAVDSSPKESGGRVLREETNEQSFSSWILLSKKRD
jgi:hypothetical protein